jgi:tetratricopeptide (TPR) repeat protein
LTAKAAATVLGALLCVGCAHRAALIAPSLPAGAPAVAELADTPFFPQRDYQCGPAALATVLVASGVEVTADELLGRVYLPGRKGSLQAELNAASRSFDRLPYPLPSDLPSVLNELAAGRPVLVLQNLGIERVPVWHYAVVVGFDAARDELVLRSGTEKRMLMPAHRFMSSWNRAGNWAIVVLEPGSLPAGAERDRFLEAAAGLEAAERYDAAGRAYGAALARWPNDTTALLGIGNVSYARGDLERAETAYRTLLGIDPAHAIARNNLAQTLLDRGDPEAAHAEIVAARAALTDERLAPLLAETEEAITRALRGEERSPR